MDIPPQHADRRRARRSRALEPLPYDGDAFMLSSSARVRGEDRAFFDRMFPGKVVRHEIGATHRQAMHPQNPAFVRALAESIAGIREAARDERRSIPHSADSSMP